MELHNCDHNREDLVLLFYGELDGPSGNSVRIRMEDCESCARYYQELQTVESLIPRSPSVEPDEELMESVREVISVGIRSRKQGRRAVTGWRAWVLRPRPAQIRRLAFGIVVVTGTFFLGRGSVLWAPSSQEMPAPVAVNGASEWISGISDIDQDPVSGRIRIGYRTEGESVAEGRLDDKLIISLLQNALTDRSNPVGRFRAARLLARAADLSVSPDPDLIRSLASVLKDETNIGVRLQAARVLRRALGSRPISEDLRSTLFHLVESAANSALRMEILEILTEAEIARQDLESILTRVATDRNSFIRLRAVRALNDLERESGVDLLRGDASSGKAEDTQTQPLERIRQ